jgi:ECF sigma factor
MGPSPTRRTADSRRSCGAIIVVSMTHVTQVLALIDQGDGLIREAFVRLVDVEKVQHWNNRGHFFAAAAEAKRRSTSWSVAWLRGQSLI